MNLQRGDLSLYDVYAKQYLRLLKGEVKYYDPEYGSVYEHIWV